MPEGLRLGVEVEGIDKLQESLNSKNLMARPLSELLKDASDTARDAAMVHLGGVAKTSVMAKTESQMARVFSVMAETRTASIEQGRRPGGALLHTGALLNWVRRVGFSGGVFELAKAIQRRGVKGRFMFQKALNETQQKMPDFLNHMAESIQTKFTKDNK